MAEFSHVTDEGKVNMVNVSDKAITKRRAMAQSIVKLPAEVLEKLTAGDIQTKKGPVFQTAIIAGIMGAKNTSNLIPLCHPLPLDSCNVEIWVDERQDVVIQCEAHTTGKTGVEMEALTGASVAALTVYDMCKALSHDITIFETRLIEKSGGKHDFKRT